MDFSLFKNAHGTLSTFGELTRGMDESHVTYFKAIPNYNQQDAMFLDLFISTDALHVSSGSSAHHQEHITVHTASGILLLAVNVDEMELRSTIAASSNTG